MASWGKKVLAGFALFIVGLAVAGDGGRPILLQDVGVIIVIFGVVTLIRGVVQRFRRGSAPTPPHP
jgi:uncharacterized membrane protein YidH (DUF202 family)